MTHTFKFNKLLNLHHGVINNIAFAPEINQFATCGGDGVIKILDTEKHATIYTLRSHQQWVDDIKFSEDTLNFFSIGRDEEVKIWRTQDFNCLYHYSLDGFGKSPFSEFGNLVAKYENKKTILINNVTDGRTISKIAVNTNTISHTCFSNKDKFFATAHNDSTIKFWSPWSGELLCTFVSEFNNISSIAISPGLEMIAAGSTDGQINIWLTGDQRKILINQICNFKITALQFSPDNQFLFVGDLRGDIFAIDITTNSKVFSDSRHASGITFIKICNPLNQIAIGSLDGCLSIYYLKEKNARDEDTAIIPLPPEDSPFNKRLNELLEKADPKKVGEKKILSVVSKSSSKIPIRFPLQETEEEITNKITDADGESEIAPMPETLKGREWKIGDAVDEMLNVFGYAKGGMGAVYFVRHRNWQVKLAMKSPLPENTKDDFIMQRFIREATTWISLGVHPNIASCYFVKNIETVPRIFIEYVENGSLYDWIYKGKLNSLEIVLKFAIQFCNGMEYAHRRGVIHRDIKPSNCLISSNNDLKITDFGLVKMTLFHEEPVNRNIESLRKKIRRDITTDNSAMGTPEYMSPEQWEASNEVGPESDIYSFGIMLFEMICSRKPFLKAENDGMFKMLQLHSLTEPPNPTHFVKNFPPALKKIILKCLQKNITARYQNFNDILFDLKKVYYLETKKEFPDDKNTSTHINPETKNNYSISLLELGFANEADEMLSRANNAYKDNFPINFNYFLRQWRFHQLPDNKLVEFLKEKSTESEDNTLALQSYCIMLLYRSEYRLCTELIRQYKDHRNSSFLLNLLGIALLMSEENEEGMKCFKLATQIAPPGPEILLTYSSIFFFNGNKKTSKELYDNVTNKYPQTYNINTNQHYQSEYQIMKSLLISHYPGLPFIFGNTIPVSNKKKFILPPIITKNVQNLLVINTENKLQIWDFKEQTEVVLPVSHANITLSVHFNNKKILLCVCENKVISINWQDQTESILLTLENKISYLSLSAKDNFLAAVDENNTLTVLNLKNQEIKHQQFENKINQLSISYQENYLALGFENGNIAVFTLATLDEFMELNHSEPITALSFLEEGILISGHPSNQLFTWDLLMGTTANQFNAPYENCIEIIPNLKENPLIPTKFIAKYKNEKIVFWQRKERKCLISFPFQFAFLSICPYHQHYAKINKNNEIEFGTIHYPEMPLLQYIYCKPSINLETIIPEKEFDVLINEGIENIKLGLYPDAYISIKESFSIRGFEKSNKALDLLYQISSHGELKTIANAWFKYHIHAKIIKNVDILFLNESNIIIPCQNKFIKWDLTNKEEQDIQVKLPDDFIKLKWMGKEFSYSFILLTKDQRLLEFDANSNQYKEIKIATRSNIIDFCILNNYFCVLDNTGQMTVMNFSKNEILFKEEFGKTAKKLFKYPPGKNILIVHENFLQIFSLEIRTNQRNFKGGTAPIKNQSFSYQGRFIALTNIDGSTCIINAFTSKTVSNMPFDYTITAMHFSPNSAYLAIADAKGNLNIIDVNTDSIVQRFKNLNNSITHIAFAPNSRYIVVSSDSDSRLGVVELNWDLQFTSSANNPRA